MCQQEPPLNDVSRTALNHGWKTHLEPLLADPLKFAHDIGDCARMIEACSSALFGTLSCHQSAPVAKLANTRRSCYGSGQRSPKPWWPSQSSILPLRHSGVDVDPQTLQQSGGVFARLLRSPSSSVWSNVCERRGSAFGAETSQVGPILCSPGSRCREVSSESGEEGSERRTRISRALRDVRMAVLAAFPRRRTMRSAERGAAYSESERNAEVHESTAAASNRRAWAELADGRIRMSLQSSTTLRRAHPSVAGHHCRSLR